MSACNGSKSGHRPTQLTAQNSLSVLMVMASGTATLGGWRSFEMVLRYARGMLIWHRSTWRAQLSGSNEVGMSWSQTLSGLPAAETMPINGTAGSPPSRSTREGAIHQ